MESEGYFLINQFGLSNREAEVAVLVAKGLSNKEVANQLFVTEKTIKFHLTNIYKKINVKSRAQLIVLVLKNQTVEIVKGANAQAYEEKMQAPVVTQSDEVLPTGI